MNYIWEIKWCSPFRLRSYRKYELLFETIHFFWSVQSLQLIWLQFVASFFHKVKFNRLMFIKRDSLLMFMHKIPNRVVCINGTQRYLCEEWRKMKLQFDALRKQACKRFILIFIYMSCYLKAPAKLNST